MEYDADTGCVCGGVEQWPPDNGARSADDNLSKVV